MLILLAVPLSILAAWIGWGLIKHYMDMWSLRAAGRKQRRRFIEYLL